MWKKITLTTAAPTARIAFGGRGTIYCEGTFGGGAVGAHLVYKDPTTGVVSVTTGFINTAIDASVKTFDCPAGEYELNLAGSAGATVDVYHNDQVDKVVDS